MNKEIIADSALSAEYVTEKTHIKITGLSNLNQLIGPNETHYLVYKIWNQVNGKYYIGQHQTQNWNDSYMGSGDLITKAQDKYGLSVFVKEILFDFQTKAEMNAKEQELVQLSNCYPYDQMSYNLKEGGTGGALSPESQERAAVKQRKTWKNKTIDELKIFGQHVSEGLNKRTKEEKEETKAKVRATNASKTAAQKEQEHKNRSKATSGKNNPMYGIDVRTLMTPEAVQKMNEKRSKSLIGRPVTDKTRQRISKANSGKNNGMYGKSGKLAPHYGKKCMANLKTGEVIYVLPEHINHYQQNGFCFPCEIKHFRKTIQDIRQRNNTSV